MNAPADTTKPLLRINHLRKYFPVTEGLVFHRTVANVKAVDDVSFDIMRGETLGLVGESGCGKTTTGRCILMLETPTDGEIWYDDIDLTKADRPTLKALRQKIQVIFQDPYSSLNPRMKIGDIIGEPMRVHGVIADAEKRKARVAELLSVCGLRPAMADPTCEAPAASVWCAAAAGSPGRRICALPRG